MTTIKEILRLPIGQNLGGFALTVKTAKKRWQLADEKWMHQVLLMDETGEMLADVNIGTYSPLVRGQLIRIFVAEIQAEEKMGKKLYVDHFAQVTQIGEPSESYTYYYGEPDKVVRGKIKTWLVPAYIAKGKELNEVRDEINEWVDFIMEQEEPNSNRKGT